MKKSIREELESLADHLDIKLVIKDLPPGYDGCSYFDDIHISTKLKNRNRILSVFFHEMGHINCRAAGLHPEYHSRKNFSFDQALAAERWVDNWAERIMSQYDEEAEFIPSYKDEKSIKFLREQCKN